MRKVILASTSPRRIELLTLHGYLKDHVAPKFDDSGFKIETDDQVEMLATKKMESVKEDFPGEIIVACDTVVKINGGFLGKPESRDDAFAMLRTLAASPHEVISFLVVYDGKHDVIKKKKAVTRVEFDHLTDEEIAEYLTSHEYSDKAGGYAVQGRAAPFIKRIEGDYYNIVGFPLNAFWRIMKELV